MATLGSGQLGSGTLGSRYVAPSATPPTVNVVSVSKAKISAIAGANSSTVTFTSDQAFQTYSVRIVNSSTAAVTDGIEVEGATGSWAANGSNQIVITNSEMTAAGSVEGSNLLKIFVQNTNGVWSDGVVADTTIYSILGEGSFGNFSLGTS